MWKGTRCTENSNGNNTNKYGNKKTISRRDFFKIAGAAGMATAGLTACGDRQGSLTSANAGEPGGEMTYRTLTGDRVSLLGYGCMRWPMMPNPDGEGQVVDQEEVNRLVDYALAHGVNYFDTAPPYCQGCRRKRRALPSADIRATRITLPRRCPTTASTGQGFVARSCTMPV